MTFKVGDLVQLVSGGPPMTVESVGPDDYVADGQVRVLWMGSDQHGRPEMHARHVPAIALRLGTTLGTPTAETDADTRN